MFYRKILFVFTLLCISRFLFAGDTVGPAGLICNSGPEGICDATNYTWYETLDLDSGKISGSWSPSKPGNVGVGYSATATGYGYVEISLSYTIGDTSGSVNLRDEVGYYGVLGFLPITIPVINASIGSTHPVGSIGSHFGSYS